MCIQQVITTRNGTPDAINREVTAGRFFFWMNTNMPTSTRRKLRGEHKFPRGEALGVFETCRRCGCRCGVFLTVMAHRRTNERNGRSPRVVLGACCKAGQEPQQTKNESSELRAAWWWKAGKFSDDVMHHSQETFAFFRVNLGKGGASD